MQSQQILTKAIEKAIAGGWTSGYLLGFHPLGAGGIASIYIGEGVQQLIYDHNFAKALWGEDANRLWKCPACGYSFEYYKHNETQEYCPNDGRKVQDVTEPKPIWEQTYAEHLQQMVIAEDPIAYLGQNI